jgi:hypothetical protein
VEERFASFYYFSALFILVITGYYGSPKKDVNDI